MKKFAIIFLAFSFLYACSVPSSYSGIGFDDSPQASDEYIDDYVKQFDVVFPIKESPFPHVQTSIVIQYPSFSGYTELNSAIANHVLAMLHLSISEISLDAFSYFSDYAVIQVLVKNVYESEAVITFDIQSELATHSKVHNNHIYLTVDKDSMNLVDYSSAESEVIVNSVQQQNFSVVEGSYIGGWDESDQRTIQSFCELIQGGESLYIGDYGDYLLVRFPYSDSPCNYVIIKIDK